MTNAGYNGNKYSYVQANLYHLSTNDKCRLQRQFYLQVALKLRKILPPTPANLQLPP